jgi:hypothetical protein
MSEDEETEKYKEILYKGFAYSSEQFDKAMLYVSAGALGVSITFIEKIVPLDKAHNKWLLLLSWILEVVTILLFTLNHYLSFKAFNNEIVQLYVEKKKQKTNDRLVKWLNLAMIVSLPLGLISFIIFIFINI